MPKVGCAEGTGPQFVIAYDSAHTPVYTYRADQPATVAALGPGSYARCATLQPGPELVYLQEPDPMLGASLGALLIAGIANRRRVESALTSLPVLLLAPAVTVGLVLWLGGWL